MKTHSRQIEVDLNQWFRNYYGVIGYAEALKLGVSRHSVDSRAARGEWIRIYRGVYRHAAYPRGPYQDHRAAFVATSGVAVASHASAAWLWGLLAQPPRIPELTVSLSIPGSHDRAYVVIHRSRDLDLAKAVLQNTILVTNPLRTLVDLAAVASSNALTEAVDRALAKRLLSTEGLVAEIERLSRPGRTGVGALRRHLLDRGFIGAPEPSVLEALTRRLVMATGLRSPTIECRAGEGLDYRLDIAWSEILFAVEVDGYLWHWSPEHMQRDAKRRNRLQQAGWTVLVYTWRDVVNEPRRVAREITETYRRLTDKA